MKAANLIILLTIFAYACTGTATLSQPDGKPTQELAQSLSDSLTVSINALNLSEDMSKILSTKNDELLIFIYEKTDNGILGPPVLQQTMLLDLNHRKKNFLWKKDSSLIGRDLLFLMIEQDYETPIEQLDPIIRVQHKHIIDAFKKRDYQKMRTYLGTEDFLGYKTLQNFSLATDYSFNIKGVYKLDLYEYEININAH